MVRLEVLEDEGTLPQCRLWGGDELRKLLAHPELWGPLTLSAFMGFWAVGKGFLVFEGAEGAGFFQRGWLALAAVSGTALVGFLAFASLSGTHPTLSMILSISLQYWSAVYLPLDRFPLWLQPLVRLNPVTLGAEALRGGPVWPLLVTGVLLLVTGTGLLTRKARKALR